VNFIEEHHLANILYDHAIQVSLTQLIPSGVLERHPRLKIVISERGTAWNPVLPGEDRRLVREPARGPRAHDEALGVLPAAGVVHVRPRARAAGGGRHAPAGSPDVRVHYPHIESSWPDSRANFLRDCARATPAIQKKLSHENFASLYGIEVPTT